ncbi:MAG: DNA mismatch repair endonuclease MutL [Gammaproteobacteria bacterium]|nr:DNA mismatch repair endonuclease MutL [Gammaproteobacteria bacterium]
MTNKPINRLDETIAIQIAASEVIDRPASVIRELLENSVDSGAQDIEIHLNKGGKEFIKIIDNGSGIEKNQLPIALERHATSKLITLEDLESLDSLGFRGEALASIASVAPVKIVSKPVYQEHAYSLESNVNALPKLTSANDGTTIEVRDLFCFTPARRKFLKSDRSEFIRIDEVIKKIALANLSFNIKVFHQGKLVRQIDRVKDLSNAKTRLAQLINSELYDHLSFHQAQVSFGTLSAWIAHPRFSRSQPDMQYIILNNRVIKDGALSNAIKRSFADHMMIGRSAVVILYLQLDPSTIDFNVHPTKEQVKFQDVQIIQKSIIKVIKNGLDSILTPTQETSSHNLNHLADFNLNKHSANKQPSLAYTDTFVHHKEPISSSFVESQIDINQPKQLYSPSTHVPQDPNTLNVNQTTVLNNEIHSIQIPTLGFAFKHLFGKYILSHSENELILVDAHAAHERIIYETLKSQYSDQGVSSQQLILPITLSINQEEQNVLQNLQPVLEQFGFKYQLTSNKASFTSFPKLMRINNGDQFVRDLLADYIQDDTQTVEGKVNAILASIACHSSIRANRDLSVPEMNALLRQMEQTSSASVCNHGRPTWLKLNEEAIDKLFHRD